VWGRLSFVVLAMSASVASPAFCSAPFPGTVCRLARGTAWFVNCRPSRHSYSGWVCRVYFPSHSLARQFAQQAAGQLAASSFRGTRYNLPFVRVRRQGQWWVASVPVLVPHSPAAPGGCPSQWVVL